MPALPPGRWHRCLRRGGRARTRSRRPPTRPSWCATAGRAGRATCAPRSTCCLRQQTCSRARRCRSWPSSARWRCKILLTIPSRWAGGGATPKKAAGGVAMMGTRSGGASCRCLSARRSVAAWRQSPGPKPRAGGGLWSVWARALPGVQGIRQPVHALGGWRAQHAVQLLRRAHRGAVRQAGWGVLPPGGTSACSSRPAWLAALMPLPCHAAGAA